MGRRRDVVAIAATELAVHAGVDAWWLLVAAVPLVVGFSSLRAVGLRSSL